MSDQTGLVSIPNTLNLDEVREQILEGLGVSRMLTIVRYTSGPQTLNEEQDVVTCDCASGSFTVNFPASPNDGDTYTFKKETASNTLTIGRNGHTIDFVAADATLTSAFSKVTYCFSSAANTWLAIA